MQLARHVAVGPVLVAMAGVASACEPVVPFTIVMGGPGLITKSVVGLAAAVAVKCIVFAALAPALPWPRAVALMVAANGLTTVVGVLVAGVLGTPALWMFGLPVALALCYVPAARLRTLPSWKWLEHLPASVVALLMTAILAVSALLFALSAGFAVDGPMTLYWLGKLVAVELALVVSIILTALWEEWAIWRLSRSSQADRRFVRPVFLANAFVLTAVMTWAALDALPRRLASPDFLTALLGAR